MALMSRIGPHASYLTDVLPAVVVFGLGLCATVAPLTATVLASADVRHAGVASGVNNAVARAASLVAVAALPARGRTRRGQLPHSGPLQSRLRRSHGDLRGPVAGRRRAAANLVDNNVLQPSGPAPARPKRGALSCSVGAPPLEPAPVREPGQAGG